MIRQSFLLIISCFCLHAAAQQQDHILQRSETEQQLENLAEKQASEPEDDSYLQSLELFRKHKLNLNAVDENELNELGLISVMQAHHLILYRKLLGNFISIYELQAIPGWDVTTIKKVLPFVRIGNIVPLGTDLKQRLTGGEHSLLVRLQQVLEKSNGYTRSDSIANRFLGSPQKLLMRYKYSYRNSLQFGITGEKDAGEQFFKANQKQGFDFYSLHFFARNLGFLKQLAIGDFTVNLGQGLIQWQSLAFKKSAEITAVKRQSAILRPYNSPGEYNFMRGAGITTGIKNFDFTAFVSIHPLDASLNRDTFQNNNDYVSAILNSGYHRTPTEISKKNVITETSFGGNLSYNKSNFHVGINAIDFRFSAPLIKDVTLYNQYAIQGREWYNYSIDYSYTFQNFHFFGEGAIDKNHSAAFAGGLLATLNAKVDVSLLYRNIEKSYHSLYGNAFTESNTPSNEKGLFTGLTLRPSPFIKIDLYADVFKFPWLRYRVDAPTSGTDYLLQVSYKPNKKIELYTRFRSENKAINLTGTNLAFRQVYNRPKDNLRAQLFYNINRQFALSERVELIWFDPLEKTRSEKGVLIFIEGQYKVTNKPITVNGRIQYFTTNGFDSRLYAFENDVLFSYSIPQYFGKGFRYYLNLHVDLTKKLAIWFRWAQTIYPNQRAVGSGLDKITGSKKSEIKLQALYNF